MGRPETDYLGNNAMCRLGLGLMEVDKHDDARVVFEAQLAQLRHPRLGPDHEKTLLLRMIYAKALAKYSFDDFQMPPPPREDCLEAINILTDVLGRARRVLGPSHPITTRAEKWLRITRRYAGLSSDPDG